MLIWLRTSSLEGTHSDDGPVPEKPDYCRHVFDAKLCSIIFPVGNARLLHADLFSALALQEFEYQAPAKERSPKVVTALDHHLRM